MPGDAGDENREEFPGGKTRTERGGTNTSGNKCAKFG